MLEKLIKKQRIQEHIMLGGLLIAAVAGVWLSLGAVAAAESGSREGQGLVAGPVRLHVIANSDSSSDQALKLMVRDAVVEYLTPKLAAVSDPAKAEEIVKKSMGDLNEIAGGIAKNAGYGAATRFGVFPFPAKQYGEVSMPAGRYKALKIVLGRGEGHNWWCVLFPPLCFVDEAGELKPAATAVQTSGAMTKEKLDAQTKMQVKLKINEIFYIKK